jgi:CHAT domain-containing protein
VAASAILTGAAASVESQLRRFDQSEATERRALAALNVNLPGEGAPTALAAYCSAAGELERVGRSGAATRARTFLLAAFTLAESARDQGAAARAAYRLGSLNASSGPIVGTRGGTLPAADTEIHPPATSIDPCAELGHDGGTSQAGVMALGCAVRRAAAAGDSRLASLASLRIARLWLAGAQRDGAILAAAPPDSRGAASRPERGLGLDASALRALSARAAIAGLDFTARVATADDRIELSGRLAETAIDAGQAGDPAVAEAIKGLRRAYPDDPGAQAYAAAVAGRIALAVGDLATARRNFERAILFESQRARPMRLADWYVLLADATPDHRGIYALEAYHALESVRPYMPPRDPLTEESSFQLHMRRVFEAAADAALSPGPGGLTPSQIAAAQSIVEDSREAEIQSAFGSECLPPIQPIRPNALRAGEIVLYPVLLSDRVELLYAAGGEGADFHRLAPNRDFDRDTVSALIDTLRASATRQDDGWREPSRRLFDLLIAPIEARLGPGTTLVIMPDGPLRALPFAALTDRDGRFLVERTRLSVAPALSYSQPGADRAGRRMSVVAAALEREVDLPAGDFAKLGGAADEARAAQDAAGRRPTPLLGEDIDFTRASLRAALEHERPSVLHLATHAAFNGRSDRSYIVAGDELIPLSDLREMIAATRRRGDPLDLVVLSACETAIGDDQAGMGLAGAAVQAGTSSALASLWPVNDTSTGELMEAFYGAYRGGATKAEALRTAQLSLLGRYRGDPFYWAGFTLIGGWR